MTKTLTVEIPTNASDQIVRLQLEEIGKLIRQLRSTNKHRVVVTIQQGQ
jgi:hypothetical protein